MKPLTQLSLLVAILSVIACGGGATYSPATSSIAPGLPTTSAPASATGNAATAPPAGAVDACALLTDDEILQATSHAVVSRTAGPQLGIFQNGCLIELADDEAIVPPEITIGVISPGGADYFRRFFVEPFPEAEHVSGIGDDAIRGEVGDLLAVRGDTMVNVLYIGFGEDEEQITDALMRSALP